MTRRTILRIALAATGATLTPTRAHVQAGTPYPSRPLRIVTPFAAGGAIDVLCRVIAEQLAIRLGQPVTVEAKPGASTILGAELVAKAPPDGYTLLITTSSTHLTNPVFFQKLPYDPVRDFAPIMQISLGSVLLVAGAGAAYDDLKGFAAWARALGRPVTFGSWGQGSSGHLFGERLKKDYGLDLNHVPYKGDQQAFADIRGGVLDVAFGSPVSAKPMVRAGQLKALGMTGPRRSPGMPEVPLFSEQGFAGFELAGYVAAYAPGGTPAPIVERLARELAAVIRMPEVTAKLIDQGQDPIANTPEQFRAAFQVEYPKWEALIRASGVQLQQ
jgi:tripartite-type tricarboxylate transporter receptor subunit TctC